MTRIRLTVTNGNRYENAVLRVLLCASLICYSDIWRARGLFDQSQASRGVAAWRGDLASGCAPYGIDRD